jgi:copper chaperone CopZ
LKGIKTIATGTVIGLFLLIGAYAVIKSPPKPVPPHEHEEEESNTAEEVLGQIDTANAKEVLLFISDMKTPKCAQEIAEKLRALGNVGKVTVDLSQQTYKIQYDPTKADVGRLMQAIAESGHTPQIRN